MCVCVCVSTLLWHLYGSCQFFSLSRRQISSDTQTVKGNKLLKVVFFSAILNRRALCSLPPRPTAYTAVHSVSRHDGYLRSGAPFISSKPGFASIRAGVIFLARSFGNLSSMGWLARGLLFHAQHQPAALSSLSGASIWIKCVAVTRHGHKYCTHKSILGLLSAFCGWRCFSVESRDDSDKCAHLFCEETNNLYTNKLWMYKGQGIGPL